MENIFEVVKYSKAKEIQAHIIGLYQSKDGYVNTAVKLAKYAEELPENYHKFYEEGVALAKEKFEENCSIIEEVLQNLYYYKASLLTGPDSVSGSHWSEKETEHYKLKSVNRSVTKIKDISEIDDEFIQKFVNTNDNEYLKGIREGAAIPIRSEFGHLYRRYLKDLSDELKVDNLVRCLLQNIFYSSNFMVEKQVLLLRANNNITKNYGDYYVSFLDSNNNTIQGVLVTEDKSYYTGPTKYEPQLFAQSVAVAQSESWNFRSNLYIL